MLALAAISKLQNYEDAVTSIDQLRILPSAAASAALALIVAIELILAMSLLAFPSWRYTVVTAASLFAIFLTYHGYRAWAGIMVPCTCFGLFLRMSPGFGAAINVVALILTTTVLPDDDFFGDNRRVALGKDGTT